MQGGPLFEQLTDLDAFAKKELSQAQRDLNEVRVLLKQTGGEVERLTQRGSQSLAKQREAEANLDNFSRQDLRQIFATAGENQLRMLMMQSQLEQLQSRQRSLDKYIETLQRIVEVAASASSLVAEHDTGAPASPPSSYPSATTSNIQEPSIAQQSIARIIQAQEDERNRVARQIHDGPAQALTNIVLRAEICERLMGIDPARARTELVQLKDIITGTLRDTRRFIFDVRPMILDDLGIFPTLKKYVETFEERSKLSVDLTIVGQECRLEPHVEVMVLRVVQEALRNVAQHAHANRVRITLDTTAGERRLDIVVEDDGAGFDVDEVMANARGHQGKSLGIASMLERVEMLGGRVNFESSQGHGTKLLATIPLGR